MISITAVANNDKNAIGGRSAAMGTVSVLNTDVFSVFTNQAGLAQIQSASAGVYAENRFLVPDLNFAAAAGVIPTANAGSFGLGVSYFGNQSYNETQIKLGYGRYIFEKLAIGIELDAMSLSINEFGSKLTMTFGVGVQYQFNDLLSVGAHFYNPIPTDFNSYTDINEDRLPSLAKIGIGFSPSDKVLFVVETEKNIDKDFIFKAGLEYKLVKQFFLRAGVASNPTYASIGFGLNLGSLRIDFANSFHNVLGYSPHFSIRFVGKNKNNTTDTPNANSY